MTSAPVAPKLGEYKPSIANQLQAILARTPRILDAVDFGKIELEIRNQSIYRILVTNSYLVKPEGKE